MKKCNARGSAARDPHGIKQITVGPPHGIKQITMFIRENVDQRHFIVQTVKLSSICIPCINVAVINLKYIYIIVYYISRAPHAAEKWGDQNRRRERVVMEGPLLPTTDSPCIGIVE
ncbi:hypothetical protein J6590_047599 [Homalodisca vitripennis]|nr:hypothetical protein J6590_047599 [Homalodisca vitripennis]